MIQKIIVKGKTKGKILKSTNPINFLGAVDKLTGIIQDNKYDIYQKSIKNSIFVFPHSVGSSVGAYTIYALKTNNAAPLAMICQKADLTVASGCALANIPLVTVSQDEYDQLEDRKEITFDTENKSIL